MDNDGPAPASPPAASPTDAPAAPTPDAAGNAAAAAPATGATSTSSDASTPAPRRGLFGGMAVQLSPEVAAQRLKVRSISLGVCLLLISGFTAFALGNALLHWSEMAPGFNADAKGGALDLQLDPPGANWSVALRSITGDMASFDSTLTDGAGHAHFATLAHATFNLTATSANTTVWRYVYVPEGNAASIIVPTSQRTSDAVLGIHEPAPTALYVYLVLPLLGVIGGACMLMRRWAAVAMVGAGAAAATSIVIWGMTIVGLAAAVVGVWAIFTIRKNPVYFGRAPKAAPAKQA